VLDDFGTGYYGLGDLGRYPLETVKIDKSFVSGPKASSLNASLVKTIVFMANHCGMKTIAEGIDTPEQEAFMRDTGCTHGQGFLFSRPTSVADIIALMAPPSPSPTASWNESVSVSGHAPSGARESSLCPAMHYRGAWSSIVVARCPLPVARCPAQGPLACRAGWPSKRRRGPSC
jgi:predicted signal transduction protein with EAL and GGDEF domain